MSLKHDAFITANDLLQIENRLYESKSQELTARKILSVNTGYAAYAQHVGYTAYSRRGSARILASGGGAKDITFVGEDGTTVTHQVYTIATGIRYSVEEILAAQARNALGKGPSVPLDLMRADAARRYLAEKENETALVGNSDFGIYGLLNNPNIPSGNSVDVNQGASGANATEKRKFKNKTAQEIADDIISGIEAVEKDGIFKAKIAVFPQSAKFRFMKLISSTSSMTLMTWLKQEAGISIEMIFTNEMASSYNKLGSDAFLIMDNDSEIAELALPRDITLGEPVYDLLRNSEQAVTERTAGCILRHPSAVYIGKGI